jgi:acyl-CoA thioester hydrolase
MVRRIEVEYLRPARLDEGLVVETRILHARGASLDLLQLVLRQEDETLLARLKVGLVCVGDGGARAARLPEPWRSRFAAMAEGEGPAPAA